MLENMPDTQLRKGEEGRETRIPVAHEAANRVNEVVDQSFTPDTNWFEKLLRRITHARSRFADRQSTDALTRSAERTVDTEKQLQDSTLALARDPLTGLLRFDGWERTINTAINEFCSFNELEDNGRNYLGVAKVDLDTFSWWNDLGGQPFGNLVLGVVGDIIRSNLRAGDLAIRHGGEEIIIIPGREGGVEGYKKDATRILRAIRTNGMARVSDILLSGNRMVPIKKDGKIVHERDATVVLKQYANNLLVFSEPDSKEMIRFVEEGKGERKRREEIRDYILRINKNLLTLFGQEFRERDMLNEYVNDHRTYSEIQNDPFELPKRKNIEETIVSHIQDIYNGELTASCGLVIFTPKDRSLAPSENEVLAQTDSLCKSSKAHGKSTISVRVGRRTDTVLSEAVEAQHPSRRRRTD